MENEITKHIDKWVTSIFTVGGKNTEKMVPIYGSGLKEFEPNISNQGKNFYKKFVFRNIIFRSPSSVEYHYYGCRGGYREEKAQQIIWKFSENKISAFYEKLNFYIDMLVETGMDKDNKEKSSNVDVRATFKNFTSTAVKSCKRDDDLNIAYNFTCSSVDFWNNNHWHVSGNLSDEDKKLLDGEIKAIIPAILRKTQNNNNQIFIQKLDAVFQVYEKPKQEVISIHPDFLSNPLKYYYLIPKIPFLSFILKRIVIHGLSNFESYQVHGKQGIFTRTLLIRNVQGSMTLDYRTEKEEDLKLNFQIDCLFLSKKDDADCVQVCAKYYTITRRKTNTLLSGRQLEVIMNRLESVLASGLFGLPSKQIGQICNVEMPLEKIEISNSSDWKTIKESFKGWIPFNNEDE